MIQLFHGGLCLTAALSQLLHEGIRSGTDDKGADEDNHAQGDCQDLKGSSPAHGGDHGAGYHTEDHGAESEAHEQNTAGQALLVREPFEHGADHRVVAQAHTETIADAVGDKDTDVRVDQ